MSTSTDRRVPGPTAGRLPAPDPAASAGALPARGALARCVAVDPDVFAGEHWGREPLLSRAADLPAPFTDLLDADAVDELVSARGLRTPFLRVAKDGATLPDRRFTAPGGVGAGVADQVSDDHLTALFADGATLVLQGLHRTWGPVVDFSGDLAAELGHPVQVNAYVTPPQSRGFDDHYDVHDVLVLQVEGEKRWRVRRPVHPAPLRDQPWTDRRAAVADAAGREPLLDVVLRPGDCLYLPRGYLHAATALGGTSIHLTVGIHVWTRRTVAEDLLAAALDHLAGDEPARASLPLGVDVRDPRALATDVERVRAALHEAVDAVTADAVCARLAGRADAAQRAAPVGPLRQARTAAELAPDSVVRLRAHVAARLEGGTLRSRAGDVDVTPAEADAVTALLAGRPLHVADLPIDGEPALDLVRRLVRRGVLVPA